MAIINRLACTCSLTSSIRRINKLKMVPLMIGITIIISCLATIYGPILYDLQFGFWCISTQPTTSSILYIILIGLKQPIVMLIFVLLTYRYIRQSRRRVGGTNKANERQSRTHFILMIFAQIFSTTFISLQWIIVYMYFTFSVNYVRTDDQSAIVFFVFGLTNTCYYLNNVKAFYISILTFTLFLTTRFKALTELLPRQMRPRFQLSQTNHSIATVTRMRRGDATRY